MEVLRSKHTKERLELEASLNCYTGVLPALLPLDITEETLMEVGYHISIVAGQEDADTVSLYHWLLHYGEASAEVWRIFTSMKEWRANDRTPWSAHRALMVGHLIGMGK